MEETRITREEELFLTSIEKLLSDPAFWAILGEDFPQPTEERAAC